MTLFNSNNFSKCNIKYLHNLPVRLEEVANTVSYRRWCTFLTSTSKRCIFCEEFQICKWSIKKKNFLAAQVLYVQVPIFTGCAQIRSMYTNCTQPSIWLHI